MPCLPLLSLLHMPYEGQFPGMNALDPNYVSRYFFSNYQKVAYTRGQETIIMSPVRTVRFYRNNALLGSAQAAAPEERVTAPDEAFQDVLDEGISYYQHADQWRRFLKVKPEQKQSR